MSLISTPKKRSITLTEVIVGAIILASVFGGLLATFVAVRKYINRANKRLVSANLARMVLDDLYPEVSADTWDSDNTEQNKLWPDATYSPVDVTIENRNYKGDYTVEDMTDEGREYRKVDVSINYPLD